MVSVHAPCFLGTGSLPVLFGGAPLPSALAGSERAALRAGSYSSLAFAREELFFIAVPAGKILLAQGLPLVPGRALTFAEGRK
ncbi:hypothetical protein [Faecalispora anaeroviscerum]|uniref:hypothetical protein n=1 Tax=Faecalispora anaeroviscerum TaxID=2991836 RepID=UPI0024BAD00E|nr:hypothetical protein [Faecalispora anaeroviscerum]